MQNLEYTLLGILVAGEGCWRSWTVALKVLVATAWAPNGCTYILGASADMDYLHIPYNRTISSSSGIMRQTLPDQDPKLPKQARILSKAHATR
jgi:hypothetical protein